jgi:hypothetical protein
MLPGKHTITGEISYRLSSWPVQFSTSFEAEAGHTYEVIGGCRTEKDCRGSVRDASPVARRIYPVREQMTKELGLEKDADIATV